MVYSPELGYDPEEWEECPESEHFLALSVPTRICVGLITILLALAFFWLLEFNKRRGKAEPIQPEAVALNVPKWRPLENLVPDEEEEDLSAETRLEQAEAAQKARPIGDRRKSSQQTRELTKDDEMALLAWKAEVHRVEQERMRRASTDQGDDNEEVFFPSDNVVETAAGIHQGNEDVIQLPQVVIIDEEPGEDNGEESNEKVELPQANEPPPIQVAISPPAEAPTMAKSPAGDQPTVVGQFIAHRIHDADYDVPTPSDIRPQPEPISTSSMVAKSQEEIKRISYDDDLFPANASTAAAQQHFQLQKAPELQPMPSAMLDLDAMPSAPMPRPRELDRLYAEFEPAATPPSTPPTGVPFSSEKVPELAAHYRQMADELTRKLLEEMDQMDAGGGGEADAQAMLTELQIRHRDKIDGALEETGAPKEVRQQLANQLETHMAAVVIQEMRRRSSANLLLLQQRAEFLQGQPQSAAGAEEMPAAEQQEEEKEEAEFPTNAIGPGKKGSSSSEEGGFVKIRAANADDVLVSEDGSSPLFRTTTQSAQSPPNQPTLLIERQHHLTPSPQMMVTTDDDEDDEDGDDGQEGEYEARQGGGAVRVSLFSTGEGDEADVISTTADDIEFVPSAQPSPAQKTQTGFSTTTKTMEEKISESTQQQATTVQQNAISTTTLIGQQQEERQQKEEEEEKQYGSKKQPAEEHVQLEAPQQAEHRRVVLDAQEAEQVRALLQVYGHADDINANANIAASPNANAELEEEEEEEEGEECQRGRQISSGAASSSGTKVSSGGIGAPGSTSMPETPGSMGFDFINFPITAGSQEDAEIVGIESPPPPQHHQHKFYQDEFISIPVEIEEGNKGDSAPTANPVEIVDKLQQVPKEPEEPENYAEMAQSAPPSYVHADDNDNEEDGWQKPAAAEVSEQQQKAEQKLQEALDYMDQQSTTIVRRQSGPSNEIGSSKLIGKVEQDADKAQSKTHQRKGRPPSDFVVEEEMLESEEAAASADGQQKVPKKGKTPTPTAGRKAAAGAGSSGGAQRGGASTTAGADGTSKQIQTNEVFDKPDPMFLFDDADDDRDVTYAPEIQSMEVPPDQLSQADSLNLVDENFSEHHEAPVGQQQSQTGQKEEEEAALQGAGGKVENEQEKQAVQIDGTKQEVMAIRHEKRLRTKVEKWKAESLEAVEGHDEGQEDQFPGEDETDQQQRHGADPDQGQQRELTPQEEAQLEADIEAFRRRTPSPLPPRYPDQPKRPQKPQAPQFHRNYFNTNATTDESTSSIDSTSFRQSSLLSAVGVSSTQEMLLKLTSLEALSAAMRKAGLESSNLIFGIDYTASNKYQGERSFHGQSLHSIEDKSVENPYQQVIKIMGRTLAPFAGNEQGGIPVFGFGDSSTGDWSVFPLNGTAEGECSDLEDVLRVYNRVTPGIDLSGPTNFAPLIYRSMEICHRRKDYHILVIIADGQVTNERATRKAIVTACQYPLSIIVVGVGDGPWDMMRVFDESLPKRPWDNFHFVEFHALITEQRAELTMHQNPELAFAVHSLLEIPDQYNMIRRLGMLLPTYYTRAQPHSPRSFSPKLPKMPQPPLKPMK